MSNLNKMKKCTTFFTCLLLSVNAWSQSQNQSALSIDQIMQGEDFVGYLPTQVNWSDDSQQIYFSWNPNGDTIRSVYKVNTSSKEVNKLSFDELRDQTNDGNYNSDYSWKVYQKGGDIFLLNNSDYSVRRVTNTLAREFQSSILRK